jgi:hypothetical protein
VEMDHFGSPTMTLISKMCTGRKPDEKFFRRICRRVYFCSRDRESGVRVRVSSVLSGMLYELFWIWVQFS